MGKRRSRRRIKIGKEDLVEAENGEKKKQKKN